MVCNRCISNDNVLFGVPWLTEVFKRLSQNIFHDRCIRSVKQNKLEISLELCRDTIIVMIVKLKINPRMYIEVTRYIGNILSVKN